MPRSDAAISTIPTAAGHDMLCVSAVLERWRCATSHHDVPNDPVVSARTEKAAALTRVSHHHLLCSAG
jgi:hypothetical protein